MRHPVARWLGIWTAACSSAALLLPWPVSGAVGPFVVADARFESRLNHNILDVAMSGSPTQPTFKQQFSDDGDIERWGYPTSEILEEENGNLTQYFQRGVIDWHASPTCGAAHCMERRLTWDYFGGGAGGSKDQMAESNLTTPPGPAGFFPEFNHTVSNTSIDNPPVQTGFFDFFNRLHGKGAFGVPKTEARYDDDPRTSVHVSEVESVSYQKHFVRQYFQAAVMEYHPENLGNPSQLIQLRLLGDDLRDLNYPQEAWKAFRSFRSATQIAAGQPYEVERVRMGPRQVEGRLLAVSPITERCSAISWQPGRPFCQLPGDFVSAPAGADLLTGDVVRVRNASPDWANGAVGEQLVGNLTNAFAILSTGAQAAWNAAGEGIEVIEGLVGVAGTPGGGTDVASDDVVAESNTTMLLVQVTRSGSSTSTTVKLIEGSARVRAKGSTNVATVDAADPNHNQAVVTRGAAPVVSAQGPLSTTEQAMVDLLVQLQSEGRLGKPSRPLPPLRTLTTRVSGKGIVTSNPAGINCGNTCDARFLQGTRVVLTAHPDPGNGVGRWVLASAPICQAGPGQPPPTTCTVVLDADQVVTVSFVGQIQ